MVQFFRRIRIKIDKTNENENQRRSKSFTFPWWCLFIAYGISWLTILISIFFIVARGIEMGEYEVRNWLTSLLISFFSSVLLTQPLKVKKNVIDQTKRLIRLDFRYLHWLFLLHSSVDRKSRTRKP